MKFVDQAVVHAQAGSGGNGCLSFRKERFRPKGGPDGGDGGHGGTILLAADPQSSSLVNFCHNPRLLAENGQPGRGNNQTGRNGANLTAYVPLGTVVIEPETGTILDDLITENKAYVVARGGKGGRGNARFATSTRHTPRRADKGQPGERRSVKLELKLLTDVGLVGPPNSGKSTLLSRISSAAPRIADYPFTTAFPNLGVVGNDRTGRFIVADTPGLVDNAHHGGGLGTDFLRHVERAAVLVPVLDVACLSDHGLIEDWEMIMKELEMFNPSLTEKRLIVAINKVDLLQTLDPVRPMEKAFSEKGIRAVPISAMTGQGIDLLVSGMVQHLVELGCIPRESESIEYEQSPREVC